MMYVKFRDGMEWHLPAGSFQLTELGWAMVVDYWRAS